MSEEGVREVGWGVGGMGGAGGEFEPLKEGLWCNILCGRSLVNIPDT